MFEPMFVIHMHSLVQRSTTIQLVIESGKIWILHEELHAETSPSTSQQKIQPNRKQKKFTTTLHTTRGLIAFRALRQMCASYHFCQKLSVLFISIPWSLIIIFTTWIIVWPTIHHYFSAQHKIVQWKTNNAHGSYLFLYSLNGKFQLNFGLWMFQIAHNMYKFNWTCLAIWIDAHTSISSE